MDPVKQTSLPFQVPAIFQYPPSAAKTTSSHKPVSTCAQKIVSAPSLPTKPAPSFKQLLEQEMIEESLKRLHITSSSNDQNIPTGNIPSFATSSHIVPSLAPFPAPSTTTSSFSTFPILSLTTSLPPQLAYQPQISHRQTSEAIRRIMHLKLNRDEEKRLLLKVLQDHNQQFAQNIPQNPRISGFIDRIDLLPESQLYATSASHSNSDKLKALFEHAEKSLGVAQAFQMNPLHSFVFCGGFSFEDANTFRFLSLYLLFRMNNPNTICIRGNLEPLRIQMQNSQDAAWFYEHHQLFRNCFASMPIGVCIGSHQDMPDDQRQYTLFTEGPIPLVDLDPLLKGSHNRLFVELNTKIPYRFFQLATTGQATPLTNPAVSICTYNDQKNAFTINPDTFINVLPKYLQLHTTDSYALKSVVASPDEHPFELCESLNDTYRIIATTIPNSPSSGLWNNATSYLQSESLDSSINPAAQLQLIQFTVRPDVEKWSKTISAATGSGENLYFAHTTETKKMFESLIPEHTLELYAIDPEPNQNSNNDDTQKQLQKFQ